MTGVSVDPAPRISGGRGGGLGKGDLALNGYTEPTRHPEILGPAEARLPARLSTRKDIAPRRKTGPERPRVDILTSHFRWGSGVATAISDAARPVGFL